jgi:hypothetical protein
MVMIASDGDVAPVTSPMMSTIVVCPDGGLVGPVSASNR